MKSKTDRMEKIENFVFHIFIPVGLITFSILGFVLSGPMLECDNGEELKTTSDKLVGCELSNGDIINPSTDFDAWAITATISFALLINYILLTLMFWK